MDSSRIELIFYCVSIVRRFRLSHIKAVSRVIISHLNSAFCYKCFHTEHWCCQQINGKGNIFLSFSSADKITFIPL